jgi:DMSO/TMAO reductase YedYZ molybdopterin-dependent catalytic subunit
MSMLRITGEVARPRAFDRDELRGLPQQIEDVGALVPGRSGGGVRLAALLDAAGARGAFATLVSSDGFSISVPLAAVKDGIVTYRLADGPLPEKQGGPVRFYVGRAVECDVGEVDACANVKGLVEIRVTATKAQDTHRH